MPPLLDPQSSLGFAKPGLLSSRPKVLVLIEPWRGNFRETMAGVVAWARQNTDWEFPPLSAPSYTPQVVDQFPSVAGYLMGYSSPVVVAAAATGKPVVKLEGKRGVGISTVATDNEAVAALAMAHFLDRGLRNFAVAGEQRMSTDRADCFRDLAVARGFEVHEHYAQQVLDAPDRHQALRDAWASWLRSLPKPIGLFCPQTLVAQHVVFAAHLEDIAVPEEIAVLGTGANDLECEMSTPPLSTIDTGSYRCGTEMARLLHLMMQGEPSQRVTVAPRGVITRRSTDMLAIDNPDLAAALRYIRDHACDGARINRLLEAIPMSRRSIEMGIKRVFGRTIRDEVVRIKIGRAKELLVYSSMILPDIAERCGFAYASHLNRIFKQHVGMTPIEYRRQHSHA